MQRVLYHPLTILIITVGVGVFLFSLYTNTQKIRHTLAQVNELEQQIVKSEQEISQLNDDLNQSKSDFVKDKIVRDELLMQKPGEYVVQLPPTTDAQTTQSIPAPTITPWQEWQKILINFKGDGNL